MVCIQLSWCVISVTLKLIDEFKQYEDKNKQKSTTRDKLYKNDLFSYPLSDAKERPEILAALKDEFTHMVPSELELNRADAKSVKFGQGLKELYFQDRDPSIDTILEYCMVRRSYLTLL